METDVFFSINYRLIMQALPFGTFYICGIEGKNGLLKVLTEP